MVNPTIQYIVHLRRPVTKHLQGRRLDTVKATQTQAKRHLSASGSSIVPKFDGEDTSN